MQAPATVLASFVSYPYMDSSQRAVALRALAALSHACAHMTMVSFAACLSQGSGELFEFLSWAVTCQCSLVQDVDLLISPSFMQTCYLVSYHQVNACRWHMIGISWETYDLRHL